MILSFVERNRRFAKRLTGVEFRSIGVHFFAARTD